MEMSDILPEALENFTVVHLAQQTHVSWWWKPCGSKWGRWKSVLIMSPWFVYPYFLGESLEIDGSISKGVVTVAIRYPEKWRIIICLTSLQISCWQLMNNKLDDMYILYIISLWCLNLIVQLTSPRIIWEKCLNGGPPRSGWTVDSEHTYEGLSSWSNWGRNTHFEYGCHHPLDRGSWT